MSDRGPVEAFSPEEIGAICSRVAADAFAGNFPEKVTIDKKPTKDEIIAIISSIRDNKPADLKIQIRNITSTHPGFSVEELLYSSFEAICGVYRDAAGKDIDSSVDSESYKGLLGMLYVLAQQFDAVIQVEEKAEDELEELAEAGRRAEEEATKEEEFAVEEAENRKAEAVGSREEEHDETESEDEYESDDEVVDSGVVIDEEDPRKETTEKIISLFKAIQTMTYVESSEPDETVIQNIRDSCELATPEQLSKMLEFMQSTCETLTNAVPRIGELQRRLQALVSVPETVVREASSLISKFEQSTIFSIGELPDITAGISELDERIVQRRLIYDDLDKRHASLQKQFATYKREYRSILEDLEGSKEGCALHLVELTQETEVARGAIKKADIALTAKKNQLTGKISSYEKNISAMEVTLLELKEKQKQLTATINGVKQLSSKLPTEKKDEISREIAKLQGDSTELQRQITLLEDTIRQQQESLRSSKSLLDSLEHPEMYTVPSEEGTIEEVAIVKPDIQEPQDVGQLDPLKRSDHQWIKDQERWLSQQKAKLYEALSINRAHLKTFADEYASSKAAVIAREPTITSHEATTKKNQELIASLHRLKDQLLASLREICDPNTELADFSSRMRELIESSMNIGEIENQASSIITVIDQAKRYIAHIRDTEVDLTRLEELCDEQERSYREKEASFTVKLEEIGKLIEQITTLQRELDELNLQIGNYGRDVRQQKSDLEREITLLQSKISEQRLVLQPLQEQQSQINQSIEKVNKELSRLPDPQPYNPVAINSKMDSTLQEATNVLVFFQSEVTRIKNNIVEGFNNFAKSSDRATGMIDGGDFNIPGKGLIGGLGVDGYDGIIKILEESISILGDSDINEIRREIGNIRVSFGMGASIREMIAGFDNLDFKTIADKLKEIKAKIRAGSAGKEILRIFQDAFRVQDPTWLAEAINRYNSNHHLHALNVIENTTPGDQFH